MTAWIDGPAAVSLTGDRVLRVDGVGGRGWLNSLLTADLRSPAPGAARYALLLNPAGGIVTDAWVVERGVEKLALVVPGPRAGIARETLDRYLLNEKVNLSLDDAVRVVAVHGRRGREVIEDTVATSDAYRCDRLGPDGLDVFVSASEVGGLVARLSARAIQLGGAAVGALEWACAQIALGVPRAGVDFFDETTSPHEAGLENRAVSLSKGCYVGQEIVTRQQRRGGITRRLAQLSIEGGEPVLDGSKVRDPAGEEIGRITSVAPPSERAGDVLALACLTPPSAQLGVRLRVGERAARVLRVVGQNR